MSNVNGISLIHVRKLGHNIEEIRSRALDNIISKYDIGFKCECDAVKKELMLKLFNWFSFESIPQPEKVLNLLRRLVTTEDKSYVNSFGRVRFQNELDELRRKLDPSLHDMLNQLEDVVDNLDREYTRVEREKSEIPVISNQQYSKYDTYSYANNSNADYNASQGIQNISAALNNTTPFDLTLEYGDGTPISKSTECGIKWLAMPWQPLVTSDKGVLAAVEEALSNSVETNVILHTCQFITNVMMQDFPAEVFLQRPAIVMILHRLLEAGSNCGETSIRSVIPIILKTLLKLTRSLRLRICYYCEPCIANKKQKLLADKLSSNTYSSSEARDSPDGGLPEANYQAYQSTATSERSHSIIDNIDDSVLQVQQMLIPTYCIDSLKHALSLLTMPVNSTYPLRNIKYVADLTYELVQLLIISIMPNIWLCNDSMTLKISEDLKALFQLIGEIIEYFGNYSSVDYFRITYLHIVSITSKLLSNIVPLEIADIVLPKSLKTSISITIMDAPIYLMYPRLHSVLQEYARQFQGTEETAWVQIFDESRMIAKSMQAVVSLIKEPFGSSHSEILKKLYSSKLSLSYHKNLNIIEKAVKFLQNIKRYSLNNEDRALATKLILHLLASSDIDVQHATYVECHSLVKNILGVEYNRERLSWENLIFLLEASILTEIILYGATHEDKRIKEMAEEILIYLLKGRVQLGEAGWSRTLEAIMPVLPLLQCFAHPSTTLGQCVTKMFDPDISTNIQLPYIALLKGNLRFLFAPNSEIRAEALCRVIWLLEKEKDSAQKLPRLSSLHGLPLSSVCIFERQTTFKRSEGNYQKSNLLSVLEMLNTPNIDPKIRKSALVQISVMLSDSTLHKLFIAENGLSLVLDIFNKALIEKDYANYPDSVIPIMTILKQLASTDSSVRHDLSTQIIIFLNIMRSLFLFPNNEAIKYEGSQLLCLLLYNEYIMRGCEKSGDRYNQFNISLPYIITARMKLPFICKSHWKLSVHRRSDISVLHSINPTALTFIRQFWMWEWHDGLSVLWKSWDDLDNAELSQKLAVPENEFLYFHYSYPPFYCQQQLYNVQNSTTHDGVSSALDYLAMYLKLYNMHPEIQTKDINLLPWEQTFERFLLSHPNSKEDCDLFVDVVIFLRLYVNITKDGSGEWISKILKNMTKSLAELFKNLDMENQDVHQYILKLARTCAALEKDEIPSNDCRDTWIHFIELVISTLCFGDQQHFYNLAYLDWLLSCLTYLIGRCHWGDYKCLLVSLGTTLIELIISFHGAGTVSFMGLSITRNSIICLNHVLYQMQITFNKNAFAVFWYDEGRPLNWLPMLWQNRDPLVRASALQLLAGLMNNLHTATQLLNTIALAPSELCQCLLHCITNREESCIVKEQGCIAFSNLVKNCNSIAFQYIDSLKPNALLIYVEQSNVYCEINMLCSNIYTSTTLDSDTMDNRESEIGNGSSIHSGRSGCNSSVPRIISSFYNCQDEMQPFSVRGSETMDSDNGLQLIATPSLIAAACQFLNILILVGQHEVIHLLYEHSVDKYLLGCLREVPKDGDTKKCINHYCDILEMYTRICTVLTNSIAHSNEYASIVNFSPDSLYTIFCLLNHKSYRSDTPQLIQARTRLWTEIFNFIAILSLTDSQHYEQIQTALELCRPETVLFTICIATKDGGPDLRMSAINCLAFLLSQEMQKEALGRTNISLQTIIDTTILEDRNESSDDDLRKVVAKVNKLAIRNAVYTNKLMEGEVHDLTTDGKTESELTLGEELCEILLHLFIAYNCTTSKKNRKQSEDKDLIINALSNLLCVSQKAKETALKNNITETTLMTLKELYVRLNFQPLEYYKNQPDREKKAHPLLHDIDEILILLMNFMYQSTLVKDALVKRGLADTLHKLWAWIALNKKVSTDALKLLATYTTKCPAAAQSLTLTTILPGTGMRKTPNTLALIHIIIQLICKEIDKAGQTFDNHKLHFAFHVLRNAVHVHECRVSISKSNLLQFFTKIHPITTKRVKPWPLVELYCLEFLMDFTFYEEGQLCVSKAVDGLDVLLHLAKCSSSSSRILAISILRNLAFNLANRPRLLSSVDFMNLLNDVFKNGSLAEIKITGSMLWSLVSNNQKGKLIARSAGFPQSVQEALRRLTLLTMDDTKGEQELVKMLQYILRILSPM